MFRNLIEMSCMSNNDVLVIYTSTDDLFTYKANLNELKRRMFDEPHLMLTRPVHDFESVDVKYVGDLCKEKVNESTLLVDALYQIKQLMTKTIKLHENHPEIKMTPSRALAMYIGTGYYDCMSGGLRPFEIPILRYLIQQPEIDLNEEVYPGPDKWITLEGFLEDTKDAPDFMEILQKCRCQLSTVQNLLTF